MFLMYNFYEIRHLTHHADSGAEAQEINGLEARFAELSASLLTVEARALRARAARETLEALLPEAFALVREASKRTWDGLGLDGPGKNGEK